MPDLQPSTLAITAGRPPKTPGGPLNPPLVMASTLHADGEVSYTRESHPTAESLENVVAALEGATFGVAFASGMAAIEGVVRATRPLHVVTSSVLYAGTSSRLEQLAGEGMLGLTRLPARDAQGWVSAAAAADGDPVLLWIETPTNPTIELVDLEAIHAGLVSAGVRDRCVIVVDNTIATPLLLRPLELGADIVMHSATKYLGGHSDAVIGVVVTNDEGHHASLVNERTLGGAIPGAMESWLTVRGVRTLAVRLAASGRNAREIAERLAAHPVVTAVHYPQLQGSPDYALASRQLSAPLSLVSFEVGGDPQRAESVCAATQIWTHATSLGGVESTLERRTRHEGESPLVAVDLIRLSVGCEDVEDLWRDLAQALDAATT